MQYKRPHEEWEEPRTTLTQWVVFLLLAACVGNAIVDIVKWIL